MSELELLPPKADVNTDANLRIHLRVLIGVLYEMTKVCGVEIGDDLEKGVLERDIIERITITFKDKNNIGKARVIFKIDWNKLELLAKTEDGTVLYKGKDFSNGFCNSLDPELFNILKLHVKKLRKQFDISSIVCQFGYRDKYTKTDTLNRESMKYMGHVTGDHIKMDESDEFKKRLRSTFQGIGGTLDVFLTLD